MDINFTEAKPINGRAIISIVGPAGSGKTASALRLATGIVSETGGEIFYADTENKRALKYSESFEFRHFDFQPPFTADRYLEIIKAADKASKPGSVIIIDSTSHEHEGMGGAREQVEEFLDKRAGTDWSKREKLQMSAWILPKAARTKLITNGLQRAESYIILLFRAKEKIKMMKNAEGKNEIVNLGIQVIGADEFAYESDVIFILPPGSQGKPDWNEDAARINDMKGTLVNDLKKIPQINEVMGKKIREFFSVRDVVPREKILAALETEAAKGTAALKVAFEALAAVDKKTVVDDIPALKKKAQDFDDAQKKQTEGESNATA